MRRGQCFDRKAFRRGLPAVDFSHGYLSRSQQSPEQQGGGFRARQDGLRLDPTLEFLVQAFDRIRCADRFPLAFRETREGEQLVAGLLQTI